MPLALIPAFSAAARAGANCSFCGRGPGKENPSNPMSPNRPVVTSDVMIDYEGTFEFCIDCAREIGALGGMIGHDRAVALKSERDHATSRAIAAESERDAARAALDSLTKDYNARAAQAAVAPAAPARKAQAAKKAAARVA